MQWLRSHALSVNLRSWKGVEDRSASDQQLYVTIFCYMYSPRASKIKWFSMPSHWMENESWTFQKSNIYIILWYSNNCIILYTGENNIPVSSARKYQWGVVFVLLAGSFTTTWRYTVLVTSHKILNNDKDFQQVISLATVQTVACKPKMKCSLCEIRI